jgi:hypothetical protein
VGNDKAFTLHRSETHRPIVSPLPFRHGSGLKAARRGHVPGRVQPNGRGRDATFMIGRVYFVSRKNRFPIGGLMVMLFVPLLDVMV